MVGSQIHSEDRKIGTIVSRSGRGYEFFLCPDGEKFKYRLEDDDPMFCYHHDLKDLAGFESWFQDGAKNLMRAASQEALDPSVSPNSGR